MSEQKYSPEQHVNEEPRNDSQDTFTAFGVSFGIFFLIALFACIIKAFQ